VPAADPPAATLGERLRQVRGERGLSVTALAAQAGLSKGFVSQLERGLSHASVASLRRICDVLDIPAGALLDPLPAGPVAPDDAPEISFGAGGAVDRLLTPPDFAAFQVLHATVPPGARNPGAGPLRPEQSHFVLVLRGTLVLVLEGVEHTLSAGRSLAFGGDRHYAWHNPSADTPCENVWVLSPPDL